VFITDADSDCGQALMTHLAGEGASLLLASASGGQAIRSQLAQCEEAGTRAVVVNVDLIRSAEVEAMLNASARELGPIDVLVHNNNVVRPISVETGEEDVFLDIMNANARSAFVCTKAVGKTMAARRAGRIIFVGSIHAEKPTGSSFAYSASKGAVKMLAREAAIVLGRQGVNVNSIELGPVEGDDERFQSSISTLYDSYQYKVPRAELGNYDDLAGLVLYLASEEARHVNGADIQLDGGFLMHYMDFKMKKPQSAEEGVEP
jgi:NAD(P)-dependent dehydrogenase (short-subunit alcohol dehydrogenase family)